MDVEVSQEQAEQLVQMLGWRGKVTVTHVHHYNHVYRLAVGHEACYLKIYTKDWYNGDVLGTAGCVAHEVSAWNVLAQHGLLTPALLLATYDCSNLLNRPFLMTRELPGLNLVVALRGEQRAAVLWALGNYVRRMHAISFEAPGYLAPNGPNADPAGNGWQHPLWRFEVWQRDALAQLEHDVTMSVELVVQLRRMFAQAEAVLAPAYVPPRFTHGDCWAGQFYVEHGANGWQVSGVVDLEVASAGDAEADLIHLFMELAMCVPPETRWWDTFFQSYGREADFAAFRLRLLATSEPEFAAVGWPGPRAARLEQFLAATNWPDLLTVTR